MENIIKFLGSLCEETKADIAESPYCPIEIYECLRKDKSDRVRAGAAKNVVAGVSYVAEFLADANENVVSAAIEKQKLTEDQVWTILIGASATWKTVGALAACHSFTKEQVCYLVNDMIDTYAAEGADAWRYNGYELVRIFKNPGVTAEDIMMCIHSITDRRVAFCGVTSKKLTTSMLEELFASGDLGLKRKIVEQTDSKLILENAMARFDASGLYGEELLLNPNVEDIWKNTNLDKIGTVYAYKAVG